MKKLTTMLAATTMLFASMAMASAEQTLKATWTDPDDPATAPVAAKMHLIKSSLERFSGGEFKVELYPNGQLGDQRAMVQQIRRGTLHFANIASGVLASLHYPKLGIIDMPFLFKSRAHFRAVMDPETPFIKELLDEVAKETGIRILSLHPYGFRNITTKTTEVKQPSDLEGLKIRTMEIVPHQQMMSSLGANAVPIPFLELYTSLQTGVVDGQENPPSNIIMQRFYQVQGNMTETQHLMTTGALLTNEAWYQSLTDAQRKALHHAELEARLAHDGIGAVQDYLGVDKLKGLGMNVYTPTPDEMTAFREATMGPAKDWAEKEFGAEFVGKFLDHMAQFDDM